MEDISWTDHVTYAELGYYIESVKKGTNNIDNQLDAKIMVY